MSDHDILDSLGGSLLNDILSDLNSSVVADCSRKPNSDRSDDSVFDLLEQELTSTYSNASGPQASERSSAEHVLKHQYIASSGTDENDAWCASLSQFGSMSLAADFLAADTAKKKHEAVVISSALPGMLGRVAPTPRDNIFEEDEEYVLEEDVLIGGQPGEANASLASTDIRGATEQKLPHIGHHPNVSPSIPSLITSSPSILLDSGGRSPFLVSGSLNPSVLIGGDVSGEDFSALNSDAGEAVADGRNVGEKLDRTTLAVTDGIVDRYQFTFNKSSLVNSPISSDEVASKIMSTRDICYILHVMLRPLQSLDTYNNDYYQWSVEKKENRSVMPIVVNGFNISNAQPNPVWKSVKVLAKDNENQFYDAVKTRAKNFAEEKKSLGHLVKADVMRPKALLTTSVLSKDKDDENTHKANQLDSKYSSELRRGRIDLWKARVSIDRGHSAFLSLLELRRLIHAHAGAQQSIGELLTDVKTNVDILHSSLGVKLNVGPKGQKKVDVNDLELGRTLSMPKGRVLCSRAIEEGILPHLSACRILPVALSCIFSWMLPAIEGEERLLRALTVLSRNPRPSIDPLTLCQCLEQVNKREKNGELFNATPNPMRMELLHSILSTGQRVCAGSPFEQSWREQENSLLDVLKSRKEYIHGLQIH